MTDTPKDQHDELLETPQENDKGENDADELEDADTAAETPSDEIEESRDELADTQFTLDQKAVDFEEKRSVARKPNTGESLDNPVAILRESLKNISRVLDHSVNTLNDIQAREEELIKDARQKGRRVKKEDQNEWFRTLMAGMSLLNENGLGLASSEREGSAWRQVVDHEGNELRAGQPKQHLKGGQSKDDVMAYLQRKTNTGTVFDVPLYASGIWLRMKSPSLSQLVSFQYQLTQLRVDLGKQTSGLAFSNVTQTMKSLTIDFCLQFVIDANIHYTSPSDLKEYIQLTDSESLMWGCAVTLYPKGFPYSHACIADVQKCQHVTKEILNVSWLQWTDVNSLTPKQRKHMSKRFTKQTEEEYRAYQNEHVRGQDRIVWFEDGIGLRLKTPTLQEYEDAGREWIDNIIELTQGAYNEPPHGSNRNEYINSLALATTARQYSHWVSGVFDMDEEGEQQLVTEQTDAINASLEHIFSQDARVEMFFTHVRDFIDDSLLSMIAVNSFNCPKCNTPTATKFHERFPHLVPLDGLTTFFTLVDRKLA